MAKRVVRPIRFEGNIGYVPLTHGHEAIIDAEDAHLVEQHGWFAQIWARGAYAMRRDWQRGQGRSKPVMMHRVIMDAPTGVQVDHINGNGLDNRRQNLRLASPRQNLANARLRPGNQSGTKCVHWCKAKRKWRVQAMQDGRRIHGGYFESSVEAAAAAKRLFDSIHGAFARIE